MGARKMKPPRTASSQTRAFTVVLEEIRAQNKGFGEAQQLLREQMTAGFEQINRRFEQNDRRFEQVDRRFERVEHDLGLVKIAALDHSRELKEIRAGLEKKIDRDEVEAIVHAVVAIGR
jgi:hypothetical protein